MYRRSAPLLEKDPFQKKRQRLIYISLFLIILVVVGFFYVYTNREKPLVSTFPICDYTQEEIIEKYTDYTFKEKEIITDYFFYGEHLSIFENEYNVLEKDILLGKTLLLINNCTGEEYHYLIDSGVDGQMPLYLLPEGMYEVFINIDMVKKRVVFKEEIKDGINTVIRNRKHKYIDVIASKNIFDDVNNKDFLDDNYMFVNVRHEEEASSDYDVVIDPGLAVNPSGYFDNYGKSFLGMVEADELFSMAEIIKSDLEAAGLKVLITRDNNDEIVNVYGKSGRLNKAYDSNAKYYIELNFDESAAGGLQVYRSSYVSNGFSSFIADHLLSNTVLNPTDKKSNHVATRYNGLDGVISIRETGGKALAAATFSEYSETENASFALNNRKGMETILIQYFSYNNEAELAQYKSNKESYAKETAKALIEYFNKGDINDLSD